MAAAYRRLGAARFRLGFALGFTRRLLTTFAATRFAAVGNGSANLVTPRDDPREKSPAVDMVTSPVLRPPFTFASSDSAELGGLPRALWPSVWHRMLA